MSIDAIGSNQMWSAQQVRGTGGHHHHGHVGARRAGMDAAAQVLGMSSSDLRTALAGGQTLSSLAQSKGVSTDSLLTAISDTLTKANPSMSPNRAQEIAHRLVDGPGSTGAVAGDRDHDGDGH